MKKGREGGNGITRCLCQTNVMPPFCSKVHDAVFLSMQFQYKCKCDTNVISCGTPLPCRDTALSVLGQMTRSTACRYVMPIHFCDSRRHINFLHTNLLTGWLACWTQAQKGPGSNRSRDAVG